MQMRAQVCRNIRRHIRGSRRIDRSLVEEQVGDAYRANGSVPVKAS